MSDQIKHEPIETPYTLRQLILARHLEIDPDDIQMQGTSGEQYAIRPRKVKYGSSPAQIAADVAFVRSALQAIHFNPPTRRELIVYAAMETLCPFNTEAQRHLIRRYLTGFDGPTPDNEPGYYLEEPTEEMGKLAYNWLNARLHDNSKTTPLFKEGIHRLANMLYFITYGEIRYDRDQLVKAVRSAFDGLPVEDQRQESYTDDGEYLVLTDSEADQRWEEALQSYLDECVLPDLPDMARNYFDEERWIDDAKSDGRGPSLSSYDGSEEEVSEDQESLAVLLEEKYELDYQATVDDFILTGEDGSDWGSESRYYIYRTN